MSVSDGQSMTPECKGQDPLIGRVVNDRYKIVALLARGGMGKVYSAEQAPLGRQVALKVLNPNYQGDNDPEFHKRFFLEASICAKLTHPNTVTIFDYGRTDDEIYYIAMELLEGRTLHKALREEGYYDPQRALHIARQMCRSLREAHNMGVIHRDLKPANIYLVRHGDESDFVKVLDFGLVKDMDKEGEDLTQTGLFMGSPKYMSPEQIRGEHVDARCDVYALGVILYEMLTGKVPFDRPNSVNILMAHVHEAVPTVSTMNPNVHISPELEAVVMKAMAKKPDERYESMEALLNALKVVNDAGLASSSRSMEISSESSLTGLDSHSGSFTPGGLTSSAGTPSSSWAGPIQPAVPERAPGGRWKVFATVIALAIAAGVALAVFGPSQTRPPAAPLATGTAPATEIPAPGPTIPPAAVAEAQAPGTVRIALRSEPSGALVIVGNRSYRTPADIEWGGEDATPGREVTFQFELDGYRDLSISRVMQAGAMTVTAELEAGTAGPVRRPVRRPSTTMTTNGGPVVTPRGFRDTPY